MKINKASLVNYIVLILILTVSLAIVYWNFWQFNQTIESAKNQINILGADGVKKSVSASVLKADLLSRLRELRRYGEWPLEAVPLSEGRGDPFSPKSRR